MPAGLVPFCPGGKTIDSMPTQESSDVLEIFALKKPVWSFQYGPLLGYFVGFSLINYYF
jgi:hypothetical protein